MKTKILLIGVGLCLLSSFCRAGIMTVALEDDGDGALVCNTFIYDSGGDTTVKEVSAPMVGDQYGEVAHIVGDITTSDALDPTLSMGNSIDNDTGYAWTAYNVNVYMSSDFDILNEYVSTPNDWTVSVTQPTYNGVDYMGQIQYSGGTSVAIGGTFDFGYDIDFEGYTNFSFCQEMVAIPEPASLGLIALMFGGLYFRRRFFVI